MNEGILYSIAEVSVALAGFSGIAAALNIKSRNTWSPTEMRMLWFLVTDSFMVLLFALLPLPFHLGGWSHELVWGVCTGLLGIWYVIANLLAFQGERRDRASKKAIDLPIITPLLFGMSLAAILMGIALLLSAFDIIVPRGQAMYVGGLIVLIAFAAVEFLFFIAVASRQKNT